MLMPDSVQTGLVQLKDLFGRMDQAYEALALQTGFHCRGCEDNCCRSLFYHHTVAEYLFLRQGLGRLSAARRTEICERAQRSSGRGTSAEVSEAGGMCPLNEEGLCVLYAQRPMICRLHGIPHQLRRPDGTLQTGPGCSAFYNGNGRTDSLRFDRTPWYLALARLEGELRRATGFQGRIRLTIADMMLEEVQGLEIYI